MTMYDRIKKLRLEQDMSQEELARKVGYKGRSMIARIESGQVDISQSKVKAFARALNTSIDYLMDGKTPINDFHLFVLNEHSTTSTDTLCLRLQHDTKDPTTKKAPGFSRELLFYFDNVEL